MFFLHIWDVRLAVYGLDGSVEKMEIPKNVSGFLFSLDSIGFLIISDSKGGAINNSKTDKAKGRVL